jgi:DHA1 family multidrug resistance protein-like MFS transporter/DHA1 family quinolone resistance protein-like MFS transporter
LVGLDPRWPMAGAVTCFGACLILLTFGRSRTARRVAAAPSENGQQPVLDPRLLADYRWMSRVTLFCAWAAQAIARSQFALLFVSLGHSEAQFGLFMTTFAVCNCLSLVMAGRWAFWHFKPVPLIGAHAVLLAPVFMMIYGKTLPIFFIAAVLLGLAFGFAYSSHLYYGASASSRRSVRMVIHEMVISLGITVGAATGGYLGKNVGTYAPYWFAVTLIGLGMVVQLAIHGASRALVARHEWAADSHDAD